MKFIEILDKIEHLRQLKTARAKAAEKIQYDAGYFLAGEDDEIRNLEFEINNNFSELVKSIVRNEE